jgi:hypothetical protein
MIQYYHFEKLACSYQVLGDSQIFWTRSEITSLGAFIRAERRITRIVRVCYWCKEGKVDDEGF